jgi:hypothetical protein
MDQDLGQNRGRTSKHPLREVGSDSAGHRPR